MIGVAFLISMVNSFYACGMYRLVDTYNYFHHDSTEVHVKSTLESSITYIYIFKYIYI